jgi:hypothetical protein
MIHDEHSGKDLFINRIALSATVHCLTGCSIGEILGMLIGTSLQWGNWSTIALSIILAFISGYLLTMIALLKAKLMFGTALKLALASDTLSITIMEIVDNVIMLIIPGAMSAGATQPLFWGSLILSLVIAGFAAYPVNRWLISRGKGHALIHQHHSQHSAPDSVKPHNEGHHAHH